MPIPSADKAIVTQAKVCEYLLNPRHPDGGSKAVWFHSLGYSRDEWSFLASDLTNVAKNCPDFDTELSPFGIKYKAAGMIGRPDKRPGLVITVWIVEDNDAPRLVTAYPSDCP